MPSSAGSQILCKLSSYIQTQGTFRFFFFFFFDVPRSSWDLSSPTRDRTRAPEVEAWSPNCWIAREFPRFLTKDLAA